MTVSIPFLETIFNTFFCYVTTKLRRPTPMLRTYKENLVSKGRPGCRDTFFLFWFLIFIIYSYPREKTNYIFVCHI